MTDEKFILDACCGGRMFWFDRHHKNAVYVDNRQAAKGHIALRPGKNHEVQPDILADFKSLPFDDASFDLVVFDPPHLDISPTAYMAKKYGTLRGIEWEKEIGPGFRECWRVLRERGTLVFKWSATQIPLERVLSVVGERPLFGHRSGKKAGTHWVVFMKLPVAK